MHALSHKQQEHLINSLAKGEMTDSQALQYAARNKVLTSDSYTRTLTLTAIGAAAAYVIVGAATGMLAGGVVLALGLEAYLKQRRNTQQKLKLIDRGDYREHFLDDPDSLKLIEQWEKEAPKDDAVEVAVVSTPLDSIASPPTNAPTSHPAQTLMESAIAKPLQPYLILGAPGSGKGFFASYALTLATKNHGAEVWVVDPKSDRAEAGYWALIAKHFLKDPCLPDDSFGEDIVEVICEFEKRVSDRKNGKESKDKPLILFLDEVNTIACNLSRQKATEFGAKVMSLASQARSQNAALWMGGQCAILELLAIKGQTNRDIFTQVVCVNGSQPEKARAILANLGMDKSFLDDCKPGSRYWITQSGTVVAPTLKEPPAKDWGANVIDLRPGATTFATEESIAPAPTPKPKQSFRLRTPTKTPTVDSPLSSKIEAAISQHSDDEKLCDFLIWISKKSGKKLTLRQIAMSRWAEKHGRSKSDANEILVRCIELDFLTEINTDTYRVTC
jgi:hypothetical protein